MIVATFVGENELHIRNTQTNVTVSTFAIGDKFRDAEFSPDGSIFSAHNNDSVHLWSTENARLLAVFRGHYSTFDPTSGEMAIMENSDLRIQSVGGIVRVRTTVVGGFRIRYSPNGTRIMVCCRSGIIRLLDAKTLEELAWTVVGDDIYDVEFMGNDYVLVNTVFGIKAYAFIINAHTLTVHKCTVEKEDYIAIAYPIGVAYLIHDDCEIDVLEYPITGDVGVVNTLEDLRITLFTADGRYAIGFPSNRTDRIVAVDIVSGEETVLIQDPRGVGATAVYQNTVVLL